MSRRNEMLGVFNEKEKINGVVFLFEPDYKFLIKNKLKKKLVAGK